MSGRLISWTQHVGYFTSARKAKEYVDKNQEPGVIFAIKVLPGSVSCEVYKTTTIGKT